MIRPISSFNGRQLGQTSRVSRIRQMIKDVEITFGSGGIRPQRKEIILKFPKELPKDFKLPSRVDQPGIIHFMCWQEPGGAKLESSMPSLGAMMSDTQSAYNTPYGQFIEMALKEQQKTLQPGERAYMLLPLSTDTTYGGEEAEEQARNHVVVVAMQDGAWAAAMVPKSMMNDDTIKSTTLGKILNKALPPSR